ncbi:hypothetical protein LMG19282_00103 [Cupriavidus campinensis]|uniref:ISNCY family transposase n=1 Tax=Cupriavidus campinensis TaxID=151783 RepID=UPI001B22E8ED|nr:ISNCY family transposase [Cupriavidus campinensis]CAG2128989.1 hypothetical protein LMG19282_00103 [Cupriavidus campinensis]
MHGQGLVTMSMREVDRMKVIQAVADGHLARWRAAERLGLSCRHVRRLVLRLLEDGPTGLVSRKRGRSSNRQLPPGVESRVRGLIRDSYADFGPTLACEKLRERHGIEISPACVRRIMIDAGFWVPRKLRPPKVHQPRNRRACLGELVQIDGSDHAWFEDRAPACTLLVFVDDATGRLMQLLFVPTESTLAYFMATRAYVGCHGKPMAFYSDKAGIFRSNRPPSPEERGYTQFGRALFELNIDILCANTSQAKGRVERMNGTLQDRLVKELRLREISSMEAANAYAPAFMADFNARFGKVPRSDFDAHRSLRGDEDLERIFSWREWRKVSQSLTLQYGQAKGRVERMNGTLQDRLVKELRLRGIRTMDAANAYAPAFMADFNTRFARVPRSDFDAHRPLRGDEDLARIFSWREWRKVSQSLTLQYAKVLYLLEDLPEHRRLIHRYIEVAEYPDGRIELWADGTSLPYTTYDRFPEVDQGAIVENKRLGHALAIAAEVQSLRDNRRFGAPSRTFHGEPPRPATVPLNVKRQRLVNWLDLERAMQHHPLSPALNDDSAEGVLRSRPPHSGALRL